MDRRLPLTDRRWPHVRSGIAIACLAFLAGSWASTGQIARADETTTPPASAADVVLVEFGDAAVVDTWTTVNDPVMGGRSTSTVAFGDGGLVFSGVISLDNNGGFASARGPSDPEIGRRATGATSFGVRGRGDGKTYLLKVGIAGRPWSYIQRFATEAGVPRTYGLPVSGFQPVGMRLDPDPAAPPTLDPSMINRVALYILDEQEGPFQLTVSAIIAAP